jgi:hypothetical protein
MPLGDPVSSEVSQPLGAQKPPQMERHNHQFQCMKHDISNSRQLSVRPIIERYENAPPRRFSGVFIGDRCRKVSSSGGLAVQIKAGMNP